MDIIWDEDKNLWLQMNRGVSFEEIADRIINKRYYEIVENPVREDQLYFIMDIVDYTWLVPFLLNENAEIVLKTAFPSRKYHKIYGRKNDD